MDYQFFLNYIILGFPNQKNEVMFVESLKVDKNKD